MQTLSVKTNINCSNCVAKVTPYLNEASSIEHWQVDTTTPDKILTIQGNVTYDQITELVQKAGFQVKEPVGKSQPSKKLSPGFWQDNTLWKRSAFNTLNCLIGCSIGDFGMVIFLDAFYPQTPMNIQMALAIVAGLCTSIMLETFLLRKREKMSWKFAFQTAMSMSFISMIAMEVAMNATDFMIMGGRRILSDPMYWAAFVPAALAGFLVPWPYNYFRLKKYNKACH